MIGTTLGAEDSNLSISGKRVLGIEDSELSNGGIVGTGHIDRKKGATLNLSTIDPAKRKQKKDKKKKKKKHRHSSSDSDVESKPLPKGARGSARLNPNAEPENDENNPMTIL